MRRHSVSVGDLAGVGAGVDICGSALRRGSLVWRMFGAKSRRGRYGAQRAPRLTLLFSRIPKPAGDVLLMSAEASWVTTRLNDEPTAAIGEQPGADRNPDGEEPPDARRMKRARLWDEL